MTEPVFNPFEDRLSRNIRNDLSAGLAIAVETGNGDALAETMAKYRQQPLSRCYLTYLEDRSSRYETALKAINAGIIDPIQRSVILWNLGLFFEVHEVLEHAWHTAEGNMKQTLQALIRSAGVYIKWEYGFHDSARRIAAKAIPVLEENRAILEDYFKPEKLISALAAPDMSPPKLL